MFSVLVILAFLITLFLTYVVRIVAIRKSIIDIPNERSSHLNPTPRGGGIAIAITWFISITILYILGKIDSSLFYSLLCGLPIAITGVVDDILAISPTRRFIIQSISSVMAITILGGLKTIDIGFFVIDAKLVLSIFAVIGVIWLTNLYNFLDGIDGYISTQVVLIGVACYIFFKIEPPLLLAFVTLGFLFWNWQPAKIFMGDVGSTLLGFNIGIFSIFYQNEGTTSIITWVMLTSLFWVDATTTLFRRWRNREVLSKAHRKHAYQRIVQSGFSHQKTVIYSVLINIFILLLVFSSIKFPNYVMLFLIINIIFLLSILKIVDKRKSFHSN